MISNLDFSSYTYFLLFDEPLKNENKDFFEFLNFFLDFQLDFLTQYKEPQLCVVQKF
jgi:hypothetical protein